MGAASLAGGAAAYAGWPRTVAAQTEPVERTPAAALAALMAGNERFVAGETSGPNRGLARRSEVARGQQPFALVFSCIDSRVPPEIVFDRGLGDLFVVRVAGPVVDDAGLGSIEFAVTEFETPLVMVLGHTSCGMVRAAIDVIGSGAQIPGPIGRMVDLIRPAVERARSEPGDLMANATHANVEYGIEQILDREPILAAQDTLGSLDVVGAVYDLATGQVNIMAT